MNQRGAPAAELRMVEAERHDIWMFGEDGMDRAPQIANAFAMNDAHLENPAFAASGQIIRHQVLYLARLERVQIQHAINRQLDRLIHRGMNLRDESDLSLP